MLLSLPRLESRLFVPVGLLYKYPLSGNQGLHYWTEQGRVKSRESREGQSREQQLGEARNSCLEYPLIAQKCVKSCHMIGLTSFILIIWIVEGSESGTL